MNDKSSGDTFRKRRFLILKHLLYFICIYNRGQKSWDKFTIVAFFTRAKRTARREFIYIFSAASPPPPPPFTMLDILYKTPNKQACLSVCLSVRAHAISLEVQHCMGGRGESNAF